MNVLNDYQKQILESTINVVRSASGNILTNESTFKIIIEACTEYKNSFFTNFENYIIINNLNNEKNRLLGECVYCKTPCGKHSDYSINSLFSSPQEIIELKLDLLDKISNTNFNNISFEDANLVYYSLYMLSEYVDAIQLKETINNYNL